jgi:hypothetical protein
MGILVAPSMNASVPSSGCCSLREQQRLKTHEDSRRAEPMPAQMPSTISCQFRLNLDQAVAITAEYGYLSGTYVKQRYRALTIHKKVCSCQNRQSIVSLTSLNSLLLSACVMHKEYEVKKQNFTRPTSVLGGNRIEKTSAYFWNCFYHH